MSTDVARTEMKVHDDPRLLAAVGAIVSHSAHRAGLSEDAQKGIAEAAIDACRETFPLVANKNSESCDLQIVVEDFPDRVQVTIEHSGEALPTAGLDSFVGDSKEGVAAGISNSLQGTRVDRVQYETREGRSRMTMIKYRGGHKPKT